MDSWEIALSTLLPVLAVVALIAPPIDLFNRVWNLIAGYSFKVDGKVRDKLSVPNSYRFMSL